MGAEYIGTKDYTKESHVDKVDMCQALKEMMEDATNEGLQQGMQQGMQQSVQQTAMRMLKKGRFSYKEIAKLTSLSLEEVQALALEMV